MMMFFNDWSILVLIPSMILAFWAQAKVKSNLNRFAGVPTVRGKTGAAVVEQILHDHGIRDVGIERVANAWSDHYDPKNKVIRLSAPVHDSASVTAVAVAAHEAAHAIQHNEGYAALALRSGIFPAVRISSGAAMPLIMIGLILGMMEFIAPGIATFLINLGIIFFAVTVLFHLVTLPVEFNASRRAGEVLAEGRYLEPAEEKGIKKVLSAAAMTYVAAAAVAISQLIRLLLIANRRR
jgi:hypothetical protein